jgi:hypothetical protein
MTHNASKATIGTIVSDRHSVLGTVYGTVTETRGGMYNNTLVNVFWDYLGYSNWEDPTRLLVAN